MTKKHKKDPTEQEKDLVVLLLQGIPLVGILILVTIGALNCEYNLGNNANEDNTRQGRCPLLEIRQATVRIFFGPSLVKWS